MNFVAKVRFPSQLPQLDKDFDYLVGEGLSDKITFGSTVRVPFGPGGKLKLGYVTSLSEESSYSSKLLTIDTVESTFPVITENQLALCDAVAKRQVGTVGELLVTTVPKAFVRVSKSFGAEHTVVTTSNSKAKLSTLGEFAKENRRAYFSPKLIAQGDDINHWANQFALLCSEQLGEGKSTLVVLPDFTDLETFERALLSKGLVESAIRHSSSDSGSVRYGNHLRAIRDIAINYGVRGASFAPAKNLGAILLWNDGDDSHTEQSSPYWTSREVLLQRAELEGCLIVMSSHSPSAEVIRLTETGFLRVLKIESEANSAYISSSNERLDAQSFAHISETLKRGKSVLVQIANAGWATAVACVGCKELRTCPHCNSSIWIDPSGKFRCRNCKVSEALQPCACGKIGTRPIRLGASAISSQLAKSLPKATVLHSNGENRLMSVQGESILVVATPGAEPVFVGGFDCVLIADAASMIGAPRLRALEQSLGKWASAISLANNEAKVIFVGLSKNLATQMEKLDFFNAVRNDYLDRLELGLPPATRLASIRVSNEKDFENLCERLYLELDSKLVRKLPTDTKNTLLLDYPYNSGAHLAEVLKRLTTELTAKSKSKKPGERVFRINMDDSKVI